MRKTSSHPLALVYVALAFDESLSQAFHAVFAEGVPRGFHVPLTEKGSTHDPADPQPA